MEPREKVAESVIDATMRLYLRGLNSALSGNVSARVDSNSMLITPNALDKARLSAKDLALVDIKKETRLKGPRQSSEFRVHTRIYKEMKEINAVVHPHPHYSLAMVDSIGRDRFIGALSQSDEEYDYYLGRLASLKRMPAGSVKLADAVASEVKKGARVVILEGHGTFGVGKTMVEALSRVEYLEHMAQKQFIVELLKGRK